MGQTTKNMMKGLLLMLALLMLVAPMATGENITVTAEIQTYVSAVFNYNTVNFGQVAPGSTNVPAPNQGAGIYSVSISSNVPLTVSASRTAWTPNDILTLKFGVSNNPANLAPQITLTTSHQNVATISEGQYTHYHGYWLSVPSNAPAGSYSTTVTITYQPA